MAMLFTEAQLSKGTASRLDGVTEEDEDAYRTMTNKMVFGLVQKLHMNTMTLWFACTLTHRFFTYESFKRRDRLLVAAAAVFLGGKMAENVKRLGDVVCWFYALRNKTPNLPPEKSKVVQDLKEEVLAYERLMLHVMGFNLYMDPPDYVGVLKRVKVLMEPGKEAEDQFNTLTSVALSALNDIYIQTTLPIRCEASLIATIAAYLAVRYVNLPEPRELPAYAKQQPPAEGPGTWRAVLGLPEDPETFCLVKKAVDVWRNRPSGASSFAPAVRRVDLEVAQVLSEERRDAAAAANRELMVASPPPPPPPSPKPRPPPPPPRAPGDMMES